MALHIEAEAAKCLNCKTPMCQKGCPISTPIPHIIGLFKENRVMEAGKELFDNNPLSVVCAMICDHESQCAGSCVLGRKGTPVLFYDIEKFIPDTYLDRLSIEDTPKNGKRVAASSQEVSYTRLDGAEFIFGKQIVRITPEGAVFKTSILDENGKITGCEDGEELVPSDSVIIAASQGPKDKLIMSTEHLEGTSKGLLMVDDSYMTTVPGVFAAGDVVTGSLTVVSAVEEGKRTAEAMMRYMEER